MSATQRRAILVLGMHRSGTSALAGAVHLLGASTPITMIPAAADNPAGFFEAFSVLGVNDWILKAGGGTWYDTLGYNDDLLDAKTRSVALTLVNFSLIADFKDPSLLLLKDPRLCLLLDFWLPVLQASHIVPSVLLVLRHPAEIVASLARREVYPPQLALALWLQHMLEAEHATRGQPRSIIPYHALLLDWRSCLARAGRQAEIDWPNQFAAAAPEMQRFLDAGLRHHSALPRLAGQPGTLDALAEEAYQLIEVLVNDPSSATSLRRLDEIRSLLNDWRRRDGIAVTAALLRGHKLYQQPPMDLPAGWLDLAQALTKGIGEAG